ncbi:adhesion G protein-coupled receptor F5-like isoform X2 [Bombina bombina]|nr:adhesion G protein-coupled receptor F5-like isoform X2 [Bombina bombina]
MTLTPEKPLLGDTLKLICYFNEDVIDISWIHNSKVIVNDTRHSMSKGLSNSLVLYTLTIKDLEQNDEGIYICNTSSNSLAQNVYISSLNIDQTSDVDIVCDGAKFHLACCSGDISLSQVSWTVAGILIINGTATSNSTCSIYTIQANETLCPADKSENVATYKCEFQGIYGAKASKVISVTYIRKAKVIMQQSQQVSVNQQLTLVCQSDVLNIKRFEWRKDSNDNIISTQNPVIENGSTVSRLVIASATIYWSGIYFCTIYQKNISSIGNVSVEVVPLPFAESIEIDPVETIVKCDASLTLSCCFNAPNPSDFTLKFISDIIQTQQNGKMDNVISNVISEDATCFTMNLTVTCDDTAVLPAISVTCRIYNKLNASVISNNMIIKRWKGNPQAQTCKEDKDLPEIPSGEKIIILCNKENPTLTGNITYNCKNGEWVKEQDCFPVVVLYQFAEIKNIINSPQPQKLISGYVANLSSSAQSNNGYISASPKAIKVLISILSTISNNTEEVTEVIMMNCINTVATLLTNTTTWQNTNNKASDILRLVERLASKLKVVDYFETSKTNNIIQLKVQALNRTSNYNQNFLISNFTSEIQIQNKSLASNTSNIVSIAYSTMKDILRSNKSKAVTGLVISTIVNGVLNMDDFTISLSFNKTNASLHSPDCVYWDFTLSDNGEWNNANCEANENDQIITCECHHLTAFSVLMSGESNELLSKITYAGVGISIGCLIITLIIEAVVWKSVIKNKTSYMRHVCLVNTAVTLLVADIWFIIGAAFEKEPTSNMCVTSAFFSFFFYLSLFFWMLATGLILFHRLIYIWDNLSRKTMMIVAFTLGYGCPLLITIITVATTAPSKTFTSAKYCWLNFDQSKSFLAFVIPALTIVFINVIILLVVIFKLTCRPSIGERPGKDERLILVQVSKSIAVLTPLLGITWGFGIAVVYNPKNVAINGIFAALNSFQGFFLLVSTVLLDQKVRRIMRSTFSSISTLKTKTTTSSNSGPTKPKRRKIFSSKANYLLRSQTSSNETITESYFALS